MSDLKSIKLNGKTYSVTPGSHAQDKNDPHGVTPEQIGAKAANTIEPIAHGGTGANTAEMAMSNLSDLHFNGDWQTAKIGISAWHYEVDDTEQNRAQYNIPHGGCEILVMKRGAHRGVALAFGWVSGQSQMWRNNLHDDTGSNKWTGWVDVKDAIGAAPVSVLTQRIYNVRGEIFGASDDRGTTKGSGTATVHITPDGVVRVDYAVAISVAGSNSNMFNVGPNIDMIRALNQNIPNITPIHGGVCTYYDAGGTRSGALNAYGGGHDPGGNTWICGRVYLPDGAWGAWPDSEFKSYMTIVGTCYGRVNE